MKNGEFANYYELESVAPPEESLIEAILVCSTLALFNGR